MGNSSVAIILSVRDGLGKSGWEFRRDAMLCFFVYQNWDCGEFLWRRSSSNNLSLSLCRVVILKPYPPSFLGMRMCCWDLFTCNSVRPKPLSAQRLYVRRSEQLYENMVTEVISLWVIMLTRSVAYTMLFVILTLCGQRKHHTKQYYCMNIHNAAWTVFLKLFNDIFLR